MRLVWCALALLALPADADKREAVVSLNTIRALRQTADPFIGFSVSPQLLLQNNYSVSTVRMMRALSPAVLRVGGEDSEKLAFRTAATANGTLNALVFTEEQWAGLNRFVSEAGLKLAFSLGLHSEWKQLFNASYRLGFGPSWQLGYKLTKSMSSQEVGKVVVQLRQMLNSYLLQRSALLGPDFQVCDSCDHNRLISNFFREAGDYVDTVVLQLDPQESKEEDKLSKLFASVERAMTRRTARPGRSRNGDRKQIWIAETSGAEEGYTGDFTDALRWALKLGVLAHAGAHSVLRRPNQLITPTPDYWVSLLHRRLVGRTVLPVRVSSAERRLGVFAHCATERLGSVTIWGANYAGTATDVVLRVGARVTNAVLYMLTRDTWEDADIGGTLLNGRLLHLDQGELPSLSGQLIALSRNMSVRLPPQSVFFIVLPTRTPACLLPPARGLNYETNGMPTLTESAGNSDKTSSFMNSAPLIDMKNERDETTEKARQSRDNVREDLEKSSKLLLESLKAHANEYDKQSDKTQLGKLMDMAFTAMSNGSISDETDTSEDDLLQIATEISRDQMSNEELPMSSESTESNGEAGKEDTQLIGNVKSGQDRSTGEDTMINRQKDSKILSLPLIPPENLIKDEVGDKAVLTMSFNPGQTKYLFKNIARNENMEDSKIIRIKRSDNNELLVANPPKGIEDSLLYRRIRFFRKNRKPVNITNVEESNNLTKNGVKLKPMTERNNYNHQNQNMKGTKDHTNNTSEAKNKTALATPLAPITNNPTSLHYHPGEFYETLGSLKIDTNISLKDIEKADEEAIDSMIESSQDKKGGSQVFDKNSGKKNAVEKKLDESTTENLEYFKCDDDKTASGNNDKTGSDNARCSSTAENKKIDHSPGTDKKGTKEVYKKSGKGLTIEHSLESSLNTMIPMKAVNENFEIRVKTASRMKRELEDVTKNIKQILFPEEGNLTKSNHSAKPEIGMYVMDQSDGRKLFLEATVEEQDKARNSELINNATTEPTKLKITVSRRNKTIVDEERNPNFFLLNNLVSDKCESSPLSEKVYTKELPEKHISKIMQTALNDKVGGFDQTPIGASALKPKIILETPQIETAVKYESATNENNSKKQIFYLGGQSVSTSKIISSSEEIKPSMGNLLRELAKKYSVNLKSTPLTNTVNGVNINDSKNKTIKNNMPVVENSEEKIKNITKENTLSLSDSFMGSGIALPEEKIKRTNNENGILLDKLTKNHSSDRDDNQYAYVNTQSPLEANSSILNSRIAQVSNVPSVNPTSFDVTTDSNVFNSTLQKHKINLTLERLLPISRIMVAEVTSAPDTLGSVLQKHKTYLHSSFDNEMFPISHPSESEVTNESNIISSPLKKYNVLLPNQGATESEVSSKYGQLSSPLQKHQMNLHSPSPSRILQAPSTSELEVTTKSDILSPVLHKYKTNPQSPLNFSQISIQGKPPSEGTSESGILITPPQRHEMNLHSLLNSRLLQIPSTCALEVTTKSDILSSVLHKHKMNPHSTASHVLTQGESETEVTSESGVLSSIQKHKLNLPSPLSARLLQTTPKLHKANLTKPPLAISHTSINKQEHAQIQEKPPTLEMLISKKKEKLNALKLRLQQAREKMMEAKKSKYASNNPHAPVVKRSIFTIGGENKIQRENKKIGLDFPGDKGLMRLLEDGVIRSSLPYEINSKHVTGQITNADLEDTSSDEFSLSQSTSSSLKTNEKNQFKVNLLKFSPGPNEIGDNPRFSTNVASKGNLEYKQIGSGLADLWKMGRNLPDMNDEISRHKRKPRAIHYPCMKDLFFNDYETEDQAKFPLNKINLDNKRSSVLPLEKNAQEKILPRENKYDTSEEKLVLRGNITQPKTGNLLPKEQSKKSKRSVDDFVTDDKEKMLQLLTNSVMPDQLANDSTENSGQSGNGFQPVFGKTISKAVSGNGIARMYEVAKEYKKSNPHSLKIFRSIEINSDSGEAEKQLDSLEEISEDMEDQDTNEVVPRKSVEYVRLTYGTNMHEEKSSNTFPGTTSKNAHLELQETVTENSNIEESKLPIDSFIKKIEVIIHDITSTVKHGLLNMCG